MAIDRLNARTPTGASQIPFFDPTNGQDAKASLNDVAEVVQELMGGVDDFISAYDTPATGFSISITPFNPGSSVFLLITPLATLAAGTIVMPLVDQCLHGQEVLCHTTQTITSLAFTGNGSGMSGAPTTLAAGGFFRLRFDAVNAAWYRVG
jgi:hypothetical protein